MNTRPYTFDRVVRLIIGTLIILGLFLLVKRLSGVLLPFLIGWLIAYLVNPLVDFIQHKMRVRHRGLSIVLALLFIVLMIAAALAIIVPAVSLEASDMGRLVSNFTTSLETRKFISDEMYAWFMKVFSQIDAKDYLDVQTIGTAAEKLLPQFWDLLSSTWQFIIGLFVVFLVLLYVIFILIDYEKISNGFIQVIPPKYRSFVSDLLSDLSNGMNSYFRGQALVAAIVGILFAIGFKIIGLPLAITMGLFIGVLNLVPYLQTIGFVPVVFLALLKSTETGSNFWLIMLSVLVVLVIVQSTQDLLLTPKIMGKAMGLKPAIILLSLSVWGSLLGIVGMIIALPITTLCISYYKRFVLHEKPTDGRTATDKSDNRHNKRASETSKAS